MVLTTEILGGAAVGVVVILAAIGNYLRSKQAPSAAAASASVMAIGAELGSRQQMDEVIEQLRRIADAIEAKKQAGLESRLDDILHRLDRAEEHQRR
jgi:ribosomal protein S4